MNLVRRLMNILVEKVHAFDYDISVDRRFNTKYQYNKGLTVEPV